MRWRATSSSSTNSTPQPGGRLGLALPHPLKMEGAFSHRMRPRHAMSARSPGRANVNRTRVSTGGSGSASTT